MSEEAPTQNKYKRKRKKTVLQNARKYAKRGYYGRGAKLDEDTYQYFVRIMEAYREGFPSDEDKLIFVNNVFEQTENEEINCCCNQVGCRVIEMLLPFANDEVLNRYMSKLGEELRPLSNDRFASHIIEALLKESSARYLKEGDNQENYKDFTNKVSMFLLNNMEDYMWDTYGNHTLRSVLYNLAQIPKDEKVKIVETDIPEFYKSIITEYGERLITWPQFKELPLTELPSGFLQVLLKALAKVDNKLLKKYIKKLIDESFDGEKVFMSKANMMLLEVSLEVAPTKLFTKIYANCFKNNILKLATVRNTNFAVQKLFKFTQEKVEFEAMFDELEGSFADILQSGHSGVLLALGQTCKRLTAKQGSFVQNLMKALNCSEDEKQNKIVICLSKLAKLESLTNENVDLEKEKLNLHGTLMIQLMLEFNKPIKIVNSILNISNNELKGLFCNSMGSHITDSFVKSQFVGEKSREKLIRKLQGCYQDLAKSKYGSRSFEAVWNVTTNMKMKVNIMEELIYKDALWSTQEFGKIIASKINLQLYKRNKEEWKNSFNKDVKNNNKNLLEDVLGT